MCFKPQRSTLLPFPLLPPSLLRQPPYLPPSLHPCLASPQSSLISLPPLPLNFPSLSSILLHPIFFSSLNNLPPFLFPCLISLSFLLLPLASPLLHFYLFLLLFILSSLLSSPLLTSKPSPFISRYIAQLFFHQNLFSNLSLLCYPRLSTLVSFPPISPFLSPFFSSLYVISFPFFSLFISFRLPLSHKLFPHPYVPLLISPLVFLPCPLNS